MYTAGSVNAISILAPTRGATYIRRTGDHIRCNFNPRSHEGSDANGCRRISDYGAFQSSLPRGERRLYPHKSYSKRKISILAPTRGATVPICKNILPICYFNPRSHEGSDYFVHIDEAIVILFQSSLPRGERLYDFTNCRIVALFQSSLPRGERPFSQISNSG